MFARSIAQFDLFDLSRIVPLFVLAVAYENGSAAYPTSLKVDAGGGTEPSVGVTVEPPRALPWLHVEGNQIRLARHWRDDGESGDYVTGYAVPFKQFVEELGMSWTMWCASSDWYPAMFNGDFTLRIGDGYEGGVGKDWLYESRDINPPVSWE